MRSSVADELWQIDGRLQPNKGNLAIIYARSAQGKVGVVFDGRNMGGKGIHFSPRSMSLSPDGRMIKIVPLVHQATSQAPLIVGETWETLILKRPDNSQDSVEGLRFPGSSRVAFDDDGKLYVFEQSYSKTTSGPIINLFPQLHDDPSNSILAPFRIATVVVPQLTIYDTTKPGWANSPSSSIRLHALASLNSEQNQQYIFFL